MTGEEYLRACGWMERHGGWHPPREAPSGFDIYPAAVPVAEAVAAQVAEDRARAAFVAAHGKPAAPYGPLFEAHPLYGVVRAVRPGLLTVRADDGQEWVVAVAAGDSVKVVAEAIEATIANMVKR